MLPEHPTLSHHGGVSDPTIHEFFPALLCGRGGSALEMMTPRTPNQVYSSSAEQYLRLKRFQPLCRAYQEEQSKESDSKRCLMNQF